MFHLRVVVEWAQSKHYCIPQTTNSLLCLNLVKVDVRDATLGQERIFNSVSWDLACLVEWR